MKLGKLSIAVAAVALATAPALAQAAFSPAIAPLNGEESEVGKTGAVILGLVGLAAVVGGIILASDSEEGPISN
jgi:hypothetical protein